MAKPAIKVEGLWKEYVIGAQQKAHGTFYDMLSSSLSTPFRALRGRTAEEQAAEAFWALRDVTFEVQPGDVVGVIGRNGAGKSTLLKVLSRITAPSKGMVEVRGRLASLLEVGTGFHPELSGRENVFLNGAILGMTRAEVTRRFHEIVAFAEIEKFIDTPVKRYSSGMYVRLAFAVAAHLESEILVVDEVLAVGDALFQSKCLEKMRGVATTGRTVMFVSHNIGAISQLCSRAILIVGGACVVDTNVADTVAAYLAGNVSEKSSTDLLIRDQRTAQVTHLSFRDRGDRQISSCLHNESFQLIVDYCVWDWPVGAYICVDVVSEKNHRLIWSCDMSSAATMIEKRRAGSYRSVISVPAFVLPPGKFHFTIAIYAPGRGQVYDLVDKEVLIEIVDGGSLLSAFGNQGYALTSIVLDWTTTECD